MSKGDDILNHMASIPRGGEGLGISIAYPVEEYGVPFQDGTDKVSVSHEDLRDLGFNRSEGEGPGMVDTETGEWSEFRYFGLRVGGEVVATWDEGRWWTAAESNAYIITLTQPLMAQMAQATAMNREQRRRKR